MGQTEGKVTGRIEWHRHLDRSTLLNLQGNVLLGPLSKLQVLQRRRRHYTP